MDSPQLPSPQTPRPWTPWPPATGRPRGVTAGCPAKVNLHLRVGPARADGFHPLLTWMCTVGLFDTLTMRAVDRGSMPSFSAADVTPLTSPIRLTCDPPTVPADDRNLVVRVVRAWDEALQSAGIASSGRVGASTASRRVAASLAKRTPVGAGLGGGSSDAAFALLLAARLWGSPTDGGVGDGGANHSTDNDGGTGEAGPSPAAVDALSAVAARFGSDIPFFLRGPSAVCTGRGEVVRPIAAPAARWAALLLPPVAMPTPAVYRRFDAMMLGRDTDVADEPDWDAWAALPAADLLGRLVNDLEPPAFDLKPELADWRVAAERVVGRPVRMSGSGSSLFTLFDARDEADVAAERLSAAAAMAGVRVEVVELAPRVPWAEEAGR